MKFSLITNEDFRNITVYHDGDLLVASNEHPAFDRIVAGALAGDESIVSLFDVATGIREAFNKVSERVSLRSGVVYLDNEEVDGSLTDQIVRFYEESQHFKPLVMFLENIANNPSDHSRKQLYDWLRNRDFTIDENGCIVAYKGVRTVGEGDDGKPRYTSISHGTAIVDGVEHTGAIPNYMGAVVEMPRTKVTWNPSVSCNTGLHAGTWEYAHGFAQGATLTVSINPRDVVSVPHDSQSQKIRVCRYTVTDVVGAPHTSAYIGNNVTDDEIDDEDLNAEDSVQPLADDSVKDVSVDDWSENTEDDTDSDDDEDDLNSYSDLEADDEDDVDTEITGEVPHVSVGSWSPYTF